MSVHNILHVTLPVKLSARGRQRKCFPPHECITCRGYGDVRAPGDDEDIAEYALCPDCGGDGKGTPDMWLRTTKKEF